MELQDQNILLFARTMQLGGTENVVLQLCEIFKPLVNKIIVCSSGGVNETKLKEMGIKHYAIGDPENKSPYNVIRNCYIIKKIVKNENITVIHTHHRMAAFYVRLLRLYKKCYFINTSHNTFTNHRLLTRFAYKKANLIACGEMVKKNLVDYFGLEEVTVIHNAVKSFDGNLIIDPELKKEKDQGGFLVGNIGRLSRQKGMEFFIESVPGVIEKHPEVHFYIIGSGEDEEKLKKLSEDLPITFMGYRTDIQSLMSQFDLIVLSSLWEGLPLTPIEAFSVGKTIVATGVDGTLEIVENKKNGLIVEPKNGKQITDAINWLIDNKSEIKKLETEAEETFHRRFSFEKLRENYIEFYLNL